MTIKPSMLAGKRIIVFLVALCTISLSIDAQNACCSPAELGDFIRNCSVFITWPVSLETGDKAKSIVVGVIGSKEEWRNLSQAMESESIKEKKVLVKYFSSTDELDECHILYISKGAENKLSEILSFTKNKAILTVSKTKGFCELGGHINLVSFSAPVVFEVNQNAILASGLKVSHILMSHAKIITR